MSQIYGHRWVSSFGEKVDEGNVWRAVLKGVSEKQVKQGLSELIYTAHDWPPSAIEFRRLCLKSSEREMGIISPFEALSELTKWLNSAKRDTSQLSPYLYNIYKMIGSYELLNSSAENVKRLVSNACAVVDEKLKRGEALAVHPIVQPEQLIEPIPATEEQASAAMAEIKKLWAH